MLHRYGGFIEADDPGKEPDVESVLFVIDQDLGVYVVVRGEGEAVAVWVQERLEFAVGEDVDPASQP